MLSLRCSVSPTLVDTTSKITADSESPHTVCYKWSIVTFSVWNFACIIYIGVVPSANRMSTNYLMKHVNSVVCSKCCVAILSAGMSWGSAMKSASCDNRKPDNDFQIISAWYIAADSR